MRKLVQTHTETIEQVLTSLSLFSNCGAGDVGYRKAGFMFSVMAELEEKRLKVCSLNHPEATPVKGDLRQTWQDVVEAWKKKQHTSHLDLLCACPPCQGMSSARAGMGSAQNPEDGGRDERNLLVEVIGHVVEALKPRVVVLENVPQFLTRLVPHPVNKLGITAPQLLYERIGQDYEFFPVVLDVADYGVPQTRRRCFITLVRRDEPWLTVLRERKLTPYPAPSSAGARISFATEVKRFNLSNLDPRKPETAKCADDALHCVPVWNNGPDDRRWAMTAATKPNGGSAWDNTRCVNGHENAQVKPEAAICPQCSAPLLRPVVKEAGRWRLIKGFRSSSYRRLKLNDVASTVTTASGHIGSDINLHPVEHRLLSVRECAILQTFPTDFNWGDAPTAWGLGKVREMIGEAVPPRFTEAHGQVLHSLLGDIPSFENLLPTSDERAHRAQIKFSGKQSQVKLEVSN